MEYGRASAETRRQPGVSTSAVSKILKWQGEKNWLLIKKTDEHSQINWTLQEALTEEKESTLRERKPVC